MRASRPWIAVASLLLAAASCSVEDVDFSGKRCPCDEGWVCDGTQDICVPASSTDGGGASGGASGSAGSGGSWAGSSSGGVGGVGGVSGTAGSTGGCTSLQKPCDGACVFKTDPAFGCSESNCAPCPSFTHASAACSAGACTLGTCDLGWDDCNGNPGDGCEFPANDDLNCGACNKTCSLTNASSSSCQNSECKPVCNSGFLDCSTPSGSTPDDGCETSTSGTDQHCGSCSNNCTTQGASGGFDCKGSGSCGCTATSQCLLSGNVTGNCNITSGLCVCAGLTCRAGEACAKQGGVTRCSCNGGGPCTGTQACCAGSGCATLSSDPNNCGVCGRQCASGQTCSGGVCL